jgi:hypothetical protein
MSKPLKERSKMNSKPVSLMRISYTYGILTAQESFVLVVHTWQPVRTVRREDYGTNDT